MSSSSEGSPDLNRRDFLAAAAAVTCACAVGCPFAADAFAAADAAPVDVGTLADFAKDGPYDKFAKKPTSLLVIRGEGKLYAPTALCTHKNANLKVEDGEIVCPKHDSPFDNQGLPKPKTKEGDDTPAKKPLVRYAISKNGDGHILVDKSRTFEKGQWDDPSSFVKVS
jgi:nitrite reductase/ring-hydroxylating ferredoxin subunit